MKINNKSTLKSGLLANLISVKFKFLRLVFIWLLSFLIISGGTSCVTNSLRKQQRKVERTQEKSAKKDRKQYKKIVKNHIKKQSGDTRKMMKKTKKKAGEFNKNLDRRFFLWRWLNV